MTMAMTVQNYLSDRNVSYDLRLHDHTMSSLRTADAAHVPANQLAKGVVLEDDNGFMMAVLPADCHVRFNWLRKATGRDVELATEHELAGLFDDCEIGAIPPLGEAYGMETIVDDSFPAGSDIYFEAGDHEKLICMSTEDFMRLQSNAKHVHFAAPSW